MATIVLQAVGTTVGAVFGGPVGAAVGRAVGALAGSVIDQQLFGPGDNSVSGPRLESTLALTSREGSAIARVYGRARVAGEIIWATNFEEMQSTERQSSGGKGGSPTTTTTTYSYFANFAIGLCEGEIATIGRIWADGKLIDNTLHTIRFYKGTSYQQPDSLIAAKQGAGGAPAYRGLAYLVFENFAVADYGNRIPQIAVEVIRPIGDLEKHVHGVNMIPGATEFGYDTQPVVEAVSEVESRKLNLHQTISDTDFNASLDELISVCPNLKQIALVVTWFGDDLRAGHCRVKPRVETNSRNIIEGEEWHVAGLDRANAELVSTVDGSPAYGGTPSDNTVVRAIAAIKAKGLKVCLNPFVMMDVPSANGLPDPYGKAQQDVYPWRGRITCHPAPGQPGSPDGTQQAGQEVANFIGSASLAEISVSGNRVDHGNMTEWTYRRMMLHYMRLAALAGGVDMFLIGSEFRGMTSVRGALQNFPFVDALNVLAYEAKAVLGPSTIVTYGADWSEYFGLQPSDGSGDVYFNLDSLWSSPSIDVVGIDNYMPLSDWRDEGDPMGQGRSPDDPVMLMSRMAAGEGYDWYYASQTDRSNGVRTPITDGLGKPWIFRYKDLKSWWSNYHFDRRGGVELAQPSAWVPYSKPFVFTEFGCPAVHNGNAQPNVFHDPKSAESAYPYFSSGGREDQAQAAYINAFQSYWDPSHPAFSEANNPFSPVTGKRMVDFGASQLWAWDARPYPAFPALSTVWSDASNWRTGHWLNGRLGGVRLSDLIAALLSENGLSTFDVSQVYGTADGYVIGEQSSARTVLDALVELFRLSVFEDGGTLHFRSPGRDEARSFSSNELCIKDGEPIRALRREQENDLPSRVRLAHVDPDIEFQPTDTAVQRTNAGNLRVKSFSLPMITARNRMEPVLHAWLHERWTQRDTIRFSVDISHLDLTPGDEVFLDDSSHSQRWRISEIEEGSDISITAKAVEQTGYGRVQLTSTRTPTPQRRQVSAPLVRFLDLPNLSQEDEEESNRLAAASLPWPGELALYSAPGLEGYAFHQSITQPAVIGRIIMPLLPSGTVSRWDRATTIDLKLFSGTLSAASELLTLNGSNALALEVEPGRWEVLQFQDAQLIAPKTWRLKNLLRGQAGTETEAALGAPAASFVVVLDEAVRPIEKLAGRHGLDLNWALGPPGNSLSDPEFTRSQFTPGYRGETPYAPVHLKGGQMQTGELVLSWVRRDRIGADSWTPVEVPLSEAAERYLVSVYGTGRIDRETTATSMTIAASDLEGAFGAQSQAITVSVRQISAKVGPGPAVERSLVINP